MKMTFTALGLGLPLLAALVATTPIEPAHARRSQCLQKYQGCQSRCFQRHDNPFPCIQRTCDRQFDNCEAAGGGKGRRGGR